MTKQSCLINEMIKYYNNDPKRVHHFLKVYSFAKFIGEIENIDNNILFILEISAIVHDIGIKISEEKYGNSSGKNQEKEGPLIAYEMLKKLNFNDDVIKRVCFLVGHHHTYSNICGIDYQILIEADFLVNIYEDEVSKESIINAYENIFKTKTGKTFLKQIYNIE